jgi:hypothetical protein
MPQGHFVNKKNFLFAKRFSEKFLIREQALGRSMGKIFELHASWMGGRSPAPRLPPVDRAGGTHFLKIFKMVPCSNLIF